MADRFDKFTEQARKVLTLAQEEAQRFNHNYIGTEHLLLGLAREGEGIAAAVLESFGVDLDRVRGEVLQVLSQPVRPDEERKPGQFDRSVGPQGQMRDPLSDFMRFIGEVHQIMWHARSAAVDRGDSYIDTEHLLLGLMADEQGLAAQALRDAGIDLARIRQQFSSATDTDPTQEGLAAGARLVIERALGEANRREHASVTAGNLLLALLTVDEGRALSILD